VWVASYIQTWFTRPKAVTHPSTNLARRTATLLMRPTSLSIAYALPVNTARIYLRPVCTPYGRLVDTRTYGPCGCEKMQP